MAGMGGRNRPRARVDEGVGILFVAAFLAACVGPPAGPGPASTTPVSTTTASTTPAAAGGWIDVHTHPYGLPGDHSDCFTDVCLDAAEAILAEWNVEKAMLMSMPAPQAKDEGGLAAAANARPGRFGFLQGGFSLNPMIHAVKADQVTAGDRSEFEDRAEAIVAAGAHGFGELAALHFSFGPDHPYEEVPPDHPLLLLLADLAAKHDVPIDLHMELVAQDKATHQRLRTISPNNPSTVKANLAAFERLLSHNASARFTWVHVGFDNTGDMTVAHVRGLLDAHPNLYLGVRIPTKPPPTYPQNSLLDPNGVLRASWRTLIEDHPDRFLLGSDVFYTQEAEEIEAQMSDMVRFLDQVPASAKSKVARENARFVYGLV